MKAPIELLRCWLHETQRVYGDRLLEEKDLEMLNKLQVDITKKIFEVRKVFICTLVLTVMLLVPIQLLVWSKGRLSYLHMCKLYK